MLTYPKMSLGRSDWNIYFVTIANPNGFMSQLIEVKAHQQEIILKENL